MTRVSTSSTGTSVPKAKRTALRIIAIVVGIILVVGIGIIPGVKRIIDERVKANEVNKIAALLASKVNVLESTDEKELEDQIKVAIASLPLVAPYQQSLSMIFSLLTKYGLHISELRFSTASDRGKEQVDVSSAISGDYTSVKAFLTDLNGSAPLVSVNSVRLSRNIGGQQVNESPIQSFLVEMSMRVHQDSPPKTIGKPSDPLPQISTELEKTLRTLQGLQSYQLQTSTSSGGFMRATMLFQP